MGDGAGLYWWFLGLRPVVNNLRAIHDTIERVQCEIAKKPHTREEVVAFMIAEYQIPQTISQYFLTFSAIGAYLSYLVSENASEIIIRDGRLFFTSR